MVQNAPGSDDDHVTNYVGMDGQTLARIKSIGTRASYNDAVTWLHSDHLGSAVSGTDESGAIAFTERYTPFGMTLDNDAANDNQAGFTGHIKDADTGLNYMQARYYDPVIGRFLSHDPVGFVEAELNSGMFNRYSYSFNDPINLIDPDGRRPHPAITEEMEKQNCGCEGISDIGSAIAGAVASLIESVTNDNDGIKEGDEVGGITATGEDEVDDIFDPDAEPGQEPRNEEEADAIRDTVRGDLGRIEIEEKDVGDPNHKGEEKKKYNDPITDTKIHYWKDIKTGATSRGKIKQRY